MKRIGRRYPLSLSIAENLSSGSRLRREAQVVSSSLYLLLAKLTLPTVEIASDDYSDSEALERKHHKRRHHAPRSRTSSRSRSRSPAPEGDSGDRHRHKKRSKRQSHKDKDKKKSKKHRGHSLPRSPTKEVANEPKPSEPVKQETEEEYDARLEREEKERIEVARKQELEEIKRRYEEANLRSQDGGIRFKGTPNFQIILVLS